MKKWLLVATVLTAGFTCEKFGDPSYSIHIYNESDRPVTFYVAALGMKYMYPDTTLEINKPAFRFIEPGASTAWRISMPFDALFEELPADTLSIYLFHSDTLAKYDWPLIRSQYKVLKRYDLSRQDLARLNDEVVYP